MEFTAKSLSSLTASVSDVMEAFHLDNVNHVYHDDASKEFAKHYTAGHKGDHRSSGSTPADDKAAEHFHNTYSHQTVRAGFGGSGTSHYTHKTTGAKYEVNRTSNGSTFWGTDHSIRKIA